MAFRDRIEVVVDFVTDPAKKGLTQLKADMAAADGVMGKAKVAATGLGSALSAYAAPAAATAAVAFAEFARRSVSAYQESALAAAKFSEAAGLTIEDASRWIAASDDVGIGADQIEMAFRRMNKAVASGTFDKYGLEIKRASDGTVDANATFQAAVTTIGAMSDATEKAQVASAVFGRNFTSIARLMNMDAQELQAALASVSNEEIFDEEDRRKAYEYEKAMDSLQDAGGRLMNVVGEGLVPAITGLANAAAAAAEPVLQLNEAMNGMLLASPVGMLFDLVSGSDDAGDSLGDTAGAADELDQSMGPMAESMGIAADSARDLRDSVQEAYDQIIGLADSRRSFERAMEGYTDSLTDLGGAMLDAESTAEDLEDKTRDTADAAIDAAKEYATMEGAALNSKEGHERLLDALGYMIETLDPNSPLRRELEAYKQDLEDIPDEIATEVRVTYVGDGLVVDENGNVRQPRGRSAVTGQSVPVAPVMPVMPEAGSEAWFAMADAAWKAGQTIEEYFESLVDQFEQQVKLYENQYELGLVDTESYLAFLRQKQAGLVQYSDEWMSVQRQISRIEEQQEEDRDEAEQRDEERAKRRVQRQREAARAEAEALYELAQARQTLNQATTEFFALDPEASEEEKDNAGRSYAQDIVAHFKARAAVLGMRPYGVRWARFIRKRIEKAIRTHSEHKHLVKWLKIELKAIPDFEGIDDGEGSDGPPAATPPVAASSLRAFASEQGPVREPVMPGRGGGGVNITVNAGLGADGQQIGREVVKALRNYQLANGAIPIKVA